MSDWRIKERAMFGAVSGTGDFVLINVDAIETVTPCTNLIILRSGSELVLRKDSMDDLLLLALGWKRNPKPTSPG